MNTEDISRFLSVAETRSFSVAAELQHVSQSALSKSIMRIESELGVTLFNRQKHPISLTSAGNTLYEGFCNIQPRYLKLLQDVSRFSSKKRLLVYVVPTTMNFEMHMFFSKFEEAYPDILLSVTAENDFQDVFEKMKAGLPNFVITNSSKVSSPLGYTVTTLYEDEILALMPPSHPLAQKETCVPKELENEKIVVNHFSSSAIDFLKSNTRFAPTNVIYQPDERNLHTIMNIRQRNCISLFNASDINTFNLSSVATVRVVCDRNPSVVLMQNQDNKDKEYCDIFRDFLFDNL